MHTTKAFLTFYHTRNGNGQWRVKTDFRFYIEGVMNDMGWFSLGIDCLVEKGAIA